MHEKLAYDLFDVLQYDFNFINLLGRVMLLGLRPYAKKEKPGSHSFCHRSDNSLSQCFVEIEDALLTFVERRRIL